MSCERRCKTSFWHCTEPECDCPIIKKPVAMIVGEKGPEMIVKLGPGETFEQFIQPEESHRSIDEKHTREQLMAIEFKKWADTAFKKTMDDFGKSVTNWDVQLKELNEKMTEARRCELAAQSENCWWCKLKRWFSDKLSQLAEKLF